MKIRYISLFLGILIVVQLGFYNQNEKQTIQTLEAKNRQFDTQIHRLEQLNSQRHKEYDELVQVFYTLKPWLNTGFKDPEHGLMKFLDFLKPGLLNQVHADISLLNRPGIRNSPIPLQQSSYQVGFKFERLHEAESFLKGLLLQHDYPLHVNSLEVNREETIQEGETVTGMLRMDLLLPANLFHLDLEELKKMGVL